MKKRNAKILAKTPVVPFFLVASTPNRDGMEAHAPGKLNTKVTQAAYALRGDTWADGDHQEFTDRIPWSHGERFARSNTSTAETFLR